METTNNDGDFIYNTETGMMSYIYRDSEGVLRVKESITSADFDEYEVDLGDM